MIEDRRRIRPGTAARAGVAAALVAVATALAAADGAPTRAPAGFRNPDDIPNLVAGANQDKESRFAAPVFGSLAESWAGFKSELADEHGFDFSLAYAYLYQRAASDVRTEVGSGGQAELDFTWTVLGRTGNGPRGLIGGKVEDRHRVFSSSAPQPVAPRLGSAWTAALGYGELDLTASQLWYEHHFVRDRVLARGGKISPFTIFDYYKYKSPRVAFLGQVQNFNPTIAFPPSALGLGGGVRLDSGGYVAAGVFDANGTADRAGFDTLFDEGELFTIAEIGWTPDFRVLLRPGEDFRPGNDDVHVTAWHVDERSPTGRPGGWGVTASVQKGFGDVVPFVRYGYSDGRANPLEHLLSVGAGFENAFGHGDDVVGVSLAFGRPSDRALRDQLAFEVFYRMQLTPAFALSPDLQLLVDPAAEPDADAIVVVSVRGRLAF